MKLLIILSGLWLGLFIRRDFIVFPILIILISLFIYKKFSKKYLIAFLIASLCGLGLSFLHIHIEHSEYTGFVLESKANYVILYASGEKFYVSAFDNHLEVGDIITVFSKPQDLIFKHTESAFDFKEYLNNKNVLYGLDGSKFKVINKNFFRPRSIKENFLLMFDKDVQSLVSSLLFGMSYGEKTNIFDNLHLYRLFNVGGVFINAFIFGLSSFLGLFVKKDRSKIFALVLLTPYFLLTIDKFSVLRILTINIMVLINTKLLKNKLSKLTLISMSGILFLFIDYSYAYQDGFILGYLFSILNIFVFSSLGKFEKKKKSLITSIFMFLFFIPFEVSFYKEISFTSPFIFTLLWPLLAFINFNSLLCLYRLPLQGIVDFFLKGLIKIDHLISFNSFSIYGDDFILPIALLYEAVLIFGFYIFTIGFKPFYKLTFGTMLFILLIHFVPISNNFTSEIDFINVGQGDSTLIRYKNETVLVDTGGNLFHDLAKETLIPYFKRNKIYNIDYLIITHNDFDHCGAKDSLMENFHVKTLVDRDDMFPLRINDLVMYNLNPFAFTYDRGENAASIVLSFNFLNRDILLMGDATMEIENYIVDHNPNLKCDLLKVGHHGSKTSSCERFIDFLRPKEAIVSCGLNNKYGHPNKEVIDVLNKYHVKYYRTDQLGTITFTS